tara:strand:- start:15199 stop:16299 length:1101 start_codon:yes stop_codon:yes gene_type:complete
MVNTPMISINRQTIPTAQCLRVRRIFGNAAMVLAAFVFSSCDDQRWVVPDSALRHTEVDQPLDVRSVIANLPDSSDQALAIWKDATGDFGIVYTEDILRIGQASAPTTIDKLKAFALHPDVTPIEAAIDSTSGSDKALAEYETHLLQAFGRFRYFMPEESTPKITWMNSGFNFAVYPTPTHLGIGLEWFLGTDHSIVQSLAPHMFPQYMREKMQPARIPAAAMRGWLLVHFSERFYDTSQCANELLYWGKILFLLEKCMPNESLSNLLDWSPEDLLWAVENEQSIWLELQPQGMLFNANRMEFGRWFDEGPFTRVGGIPQEGPDRLGAWMGLRMVSDFMDDHPDWTLSDLINTRDPLPIIKSYRPA